MKTIGSLIGRPNGPVWQEGGRPHTLGFVGGKEGERPHPLGFVRGKESERPHLVGFVRGKEVL